MTTEAPHRTGYGNHISDYPDGCKLHPHCLLCPESECAFVISDWKIKCAEWDGLLDTCKGGKRGRPQVKKHLPKVLQKQENIRNEWNTGKYRTRRDLARHLNIDRSVVERAIRKAR